VERADDVRQKPGRPDRPVAADHGRWRAPSTAEPAAAARATAATAVTNAMCVAVAQIPSGSPSTTARPHAHAPASAVGSHFPVSKAMHGPVLRRPMSTTRGPVAASMAAITATVTMLIAHSRWTVHRGTRDALPLARIARAWTSVLWPFRDAPAAASMGACLAATGPIAARSMKQDTRPRPMTGSARPDVAEPLTIRLAVNAA